MGKLIFFFLLFSIIVCGCANKTIVALVPDPDGKVGTISVTNDAGSVVIDQPYEATSVGGAAPGTPKTLGKEEVEKIFAETLSIEPKSPLHFLLYFNKETTLTADAERLLSDIIAAIKARDSVDISVVGHTDSVGSAEYNVALSNRRATAVKELLVQQGIAPHQISTTSHGRENPLIPTGDNVYEPRNRRVEVVVR